MIHYSFKGPTDKTDALVLQVMTVLLADKLLPEPKFTTFLDAS